MTTPVGSVQKYPPVGFIGLGAMGEPMAANLCRKGVHVIAVAHRSRESLKRLRALGAREAADPAEAATASEVVILMLPTSANVEKVVLGDRGLVSSLQAGSVIVDCGTSDPARTRSLADRLRERSIALVDAPVTRGVAGARDASLSYFIGGDVGDIERVQPLLALMGDEFHVMGGVGAGHTAKLLSNLVSLATVTLVAEALALGEAARLDGRKLVAALEAGSASSSILKSHGPRFLDRDNAPRFTIDLARKDLALALALAAEHAVPSFVGAVAHQIYSLASTGGLGRLDVTAVRNALEARAM